MQIEFPWDLDTEERDHFMDNLWLKLKWPLIMDSFSMAKHQSQCGSPIVSANSGEIIILDTLAEGFIDINQTLILTPEPSFDL